VSELGGVPPSGGVLLEWTRWVEWGLRRSGSAGEGGEQELGCLENILKKGPFLKNFFLKKIKKTTKIF